MKNYLYEWLILVSDWHIGHGGLAQMTAVKLNELAKREGVTLEGVEVSTVGLKFRANKNPERLIEELEAFLKQYRVDLRVKHSLFALPQITATEAIA